MRRSKGSSRYDKMFSVKIVCKEHGYTFGVWDAFSKGIFKDIFSPQITMTMIKITMNVTKYLEILQDLSCNFDSFTNVNI